MDKVRALMLVLVLLFISFMDTTNGDDEGEQSKKATWWEWQRLRSAYSIYSALFPANIGHYWHLVKALVNQAYQRFFPPNIERGNEAQGMTVTDNGAGERVKEALAKSIGKSKATMEDAAKSAANMAGETIEKVKRSLSEEERERKRQKEL